MDRIIGIDLGTTFSAVAYMSDEGAQLIPNALGDALTPSVVGIDADGRILVGRSAKELQVTQPDRSIGVFKRYMGTDWKIELGQHSFTPEKLSSLVLKSLKQDAEAHFGEPVQSAVITVPAYFNEHQRKATIRAGEIAGLKVQRILNEPTAAAIAYGWHSADEEKIIVVLDLGGGTFDVSVVELFEGTLEVRASSGETFLGGEDFTSTLAARVLEQHGMVFEQTETRHPQLISRLRQECEQAKRRLSKQEETIIRVPNEKGELSENSRASTVTREQFQKWTNHILNRIEMPIRRALGDAKVKLGDIDELILVGGATRMPIVIERATELFGRSPKSRLNPDEVVALGAAVQAGLFARDKSVEDLVVTDVSPFTLGIATSRELAGELQTNFFMPIINRNTPIPTSRVDRVSTLHANQTSIDVKIYQGEGRKIEDNLFLGEFKASGIPRGAAGQEVDIRFTYDLNGVLEVEATIVATKKRITHVITRHAKGLSASEVTQAVAEMAALKTHPRDEAVNRFLIRRAERLYQELPLTERRILDNMIVGLEEALELRDPAAIESNRTALESFLNHFDTEDHNEETYGDD
ncbi:MAG: molecular chaperone HscC [Schlesneria sp.]|nr:molecular chaperone HscC [Schlesneria sp.]